ncbi:unnamed protein product [Cercopithifilaria johnstoni]|uniref:Uncharacterized protein n=1 Tax=Cercopithifilaria johnstoni TaxID=2874296 RepID=A0A8J2Q8Z7_9BILA|nr:unnamed protein product [Cercopithifilaria johnstoni]
MREYEGRTQNMHENIIRKVEQLVADMTRQLMLNASNEEDIEVEVKMLFGKFVRSPKNATSQKLVQH